MELHVTDVSKSSNATTTIQVRKSDKVATLVKQLKLRLGPEVEQRRLTFGGQQLDNNRTIGSYNLMPHSTINMTCRMAGGSPF